MRANTLTTLGAQDRSKLSRSNKPPGPLTPKHLLGTQPWQNARIMMMMITCKYNRTHNQSEKNYALVENFTPTVACPHAFEWKERSKPTHAIYFIKEPTWTLKFQIYWIWSQSPKSYFQNNLYKTLYKESNVLQRLPIFE